MKQPGDSEDTPVGLYIGLYTAQVTLPPWQQLIAFIRILRVGLGL